MRRVWMLIFLALPVFVLSDAAPAAEEKAKICTKGQLFCPVRGCFSEKAYDAVGKIGIIITEYPGYFETIGDIFEIEPDEYVFFVYNKTNKISRFTLSKDGKVVKAFEVQPGIVSEHRVKLTSGVYSYYCPKIPVPHYRIKVK